MARPRKNIDNDNIKNVVEVIDEVTPINNDNSFSEVYNPFHENIIERVYSAPPLADASVSDIDEPKFPQPTYEEIIAERNQSVCSYLLNCHRNMKQTKKDNSVISKYIKRISMLDNNHPIDKPIVDLIDNLNECINNFKQNIK